VVGGTYWREARGIGCTLHGSRVGNPAYRQHEPLARRKRAEHRKSHPRLPQVRRRPVNCPKCERGSTGPHPSECTVANRFWNKVQKIGSGGCWRWTGAQHPFGYGQIRLGSKKLKFAHRLVLELMGCNVNGKEVMHTCDNPWCVNPEHLAVGTHRMNMEDAAAKGRMSRERQRFCKRGHPLNDPNVRYSVTGRRCRECENLVRRKPGGRGPRRSSLKRLEESAR